MDLAKNIENKLERILKKLKSMHVIKSFHLSINWDPKENIQKVNQNLLELNNGLSRCLLKMASKPRRAEIRNVISELVKKKNDADSSSGNDFADFADSLDNDLDLDSDSDSGSSRIGSKEINLKSSTKKCEKVPNCLYKCSFCTSLFKNKSALKNHELIHKNVKNFLCEYCGKRFFQISTWKNHVTNVHNKVKKINWRSDSETRNHAQIYEETKFKCEICLKFFFTTENLESHKLTHRAKVHQCSSCAEKFATRARLNIHIKKVHETKIRSECMSCNRSFESKKEVGKHVAEEHNHRKGKKDLRPPETEFPCTYFNCGKVFKHSRSLRSHETLKHAPGNETFSCDLCNKSFFEKGKLNRHLSSHQGGKFVCDIGTCCRIFSRSDALKRHEFTVHGKKKTFPCNICNKTFSLKYNRDTHEESVHENGNGSFECEICGQKCKNRRTFAIHSKTHSGKKLSCTLCKKEFNRKGNYHSHMKSKHAGISAFQTLLDSVTD